MLADIRKLWYWTSYQMCWIEDEEMEFDRLIWWRLESVNLWNVLMELETQTQHRNVQLLIHSRKNLLHPSNLKEYDTSRIKSGREGKRREVKGTNSYVKWDSTRAR